MPQPCCAGGRPGMAAVWDAGTAWPGPSPSCSLKALCRRHPGFSPGLLPADPGSAVGWGSPSLGTTLCSHSPMPTQRHFNNFEHLKPCSRDSPGPTLWVCSHGCRRGFGFAAQDSAGTGTCWVALGTLGGHRSCHGLARQAAVMPAGGQQARGG